MPVSIVASALAFVFVCISVDLRTGRIPNLLSAAAIVIGLVLNAYLFGISGLLHSIEGMAVNVALLVGPFALGGIGGGDVKMMGAVGALLGGPGLALSALACGLVFGGILMVAHLLRLGRLREKLVALREMLMAALLVRSAAPLTVSVANPGAVALPYSIPLASGTIVVVLWACARGSLP